DSRRTREPTMAEERPGNKQQVQGQNPTPVTHFRQQSHSEHHRQYLLAFCPNSSPQLPGNSQVGLAHYKRGCSPSLSLCLSLSCLLSFLSCLLLSCSLSLPIPFPHLHVVMSGLYFCGP
ncbi:mCG53458, partial [Mus musculus]